MNKWHVNIKIWQEEIKIWQLNIIIWQVMGEIRHHRNVSLGWSPYFYRCQVEKYRRQYDLNKVNSVHSCLKIKNKVSFLNDTKHITFASLLRTLTMRHISVERIKIKLRVLKIQSDVFSLRIEFFFLLSEAL